MVVWEEATLVKAVDYNIRWYQIGEIDIIASDGDMRRTAIDLWVDTVREIIASKAEDETLYVLLDLTGEKQGTTPYSIKMTRDVQQYVIHERTGKTYAAVLMKNSLLIGFVQAFFDHNFTRQKKLIYRFFTNNTVALAWLTEEVDTSHANDD